METETIEATEAAANRLAELLRHPDDLNTKLTALRSRFAKEKVSIDAQLKAGVQSHVDSTQKSLEVLDTSSDQMRKIRKNMQMIDRICVETQRMIKNYPQINQISRIHQNFAATQEVAQSLQEFYLKMDKIQTLFDRERSDPLKSTEDLLIIHEQLFKLEEFRDMTLHRARASSSQEVVVTLQQYFRRLDEFSKDFTRHIWNLTRNLLELARNQQHNTIVCLAKIIEIEENADEKAQATERTRFENEKLASATGVKWSFSQGSPRTIKSYRVQFFDTLHESLSEKFEVHFEKHRDDLAGALDDTGFIFEDLALVFDELVPRFPKKYKIFPFFVLEYHRHAHDMLGRILQQDPEGGVVLRILQWVREYYDTMNVQLGVTEELLEPRLLDGKDGDLLDDYVKLVRQKLDEWITNLMNTETSEFTERKNSPEVDTDGRYTMQGSVIMFQMVNQQIDIVSESNQGPLLFKIVNECQEAMTQSQKLWKELLQSEYRKLIELPKDAQVPGFVDYAIALANDQVRSADFSEAILKRLHPMLDRSYLEQIEDKLNASMDGFLEVAQLAIGLLIDVVFNDIKPVSGQLFAKRWYEEELMLLVVETLKDYFNDFRRHMNEYLFGKLTDRILERFLITYLEAMRGKQAKLRMPTCLDRIKSDVRAAFNFFAQYLPARELEPHFDAIEKVYTLVGSSRKMIYLDYYALRKSYPDVPVSYVEELLSKRDDLDRTAVKEIIEGIKAKAREKQEKDSDSKITIFSKLT
ncbi:uncharacterized protein VTP21DRAFT_3492 [Calcarisporiella thermophila]|uniref:uncharacterized protein n=1 Tax=Calcarisporiella thermophila TaxID=911321 RepID=UPI003742A283